MDAQAQDEGLDRLARADSSPRTAEAPAARLRVRIVGARRELEVDGVLIEGSHLTTKEAEMLEAILSRGTCADKEYLLGVLYAGRDEPQIKIVDVFACQLRSKLGAHKAAIQTVWGRGYVIGDGYEFDPGPDRSSMLLDGEVRRLLDDVAVEAGRKPDELANALLREALKAHRVRLWDDTRAD